MLRNLVAGLTFGPSRRSRHRTLQGTLLLREAGKLAAAADLIRPVAEAESDDPEARLLLADIERERGDVAGAERRVREVIAVHPDLLDAWLLLGTVQRDAGELRNAADSYIHALSLSSEDLLVPKIELSAVLIALDQASDAAELLQYVLNRDPDSAEAHCNRGIALRRMARMPEAFEHFRRAVAIRPSDVAFCNNLGLALRELDRLDEAEAELRRGLELAPDDARTRNNLASVLRDSGQPEEARKILSSAIEQAHDFGEISGTWGAVLQDLGEVEGARRAFDRAVERAPHVPELRLARAFHLLFTGDFESGWHEYEARLHTVESPRRGFPFPEWDGGDFAGRSVLVYAEQGYGDEIMFASCFPDLIDEARRVTIECDPRLRGLFARSFPRAAVFSGKTRAEHGWLRELGPIDVQVGAGSLPRRYRRNLAAFPERSCYLHPDPGRQAAYGSRLDALGAGARVGISWRGGLARTRRAVRSLSPPGLRALLERPGVQWVSLQHAPAEADLGALAALAPGRFHHWPEALVDADETAALMSALDRTVSVCNSVVHLGGALGLDVRVLVPTSPEWRYLRSGNRMPWYPSVRLFRQERGAGWDPVLEAATGDF